MYLRPMRKYTKQELEGLKTGNGGWNRATLKMLGIPWPPPKGWKKALERGDSAFFKPRRLVPLKDVIGLDNKEP